MALIDNLVAYWSLDEASGSAIDAHGTYDLTDNNTVGSTTGIVSGARDYEAGNGEYHSISDNADLSAGDRDFGFSIWVQLESTAGFPVILSKGWGTGQNEFVLYYRTDISKFRWAVANMLSVAVEVDSTVTPSTGTWYHIVCWHDSVNNEIGISVNNETAVTTANSLGAINGTADFVLGSSVAQSLFWDGLIDECGRWNRVLSGSERTELYNSGAGRDYTYISGGGATTYTATGAITSNPTSVAGTATHVVPTYTTVGVLDSVPSVLAGTATHTAPTYTATGAITSNSASIAGTATHTVSTYTAVGNLDSVPSALAGTATHVVPTYTATGAITSNSATLAGTAIFATIVHSVSGTLNSVETILAGVASFSPGSVFSSGLLSSVPSALAGTATHTTPTYTATGALDSSSATLAGAAIFATIVHSVSGTLTSNRSVVVGTATFVENVAGNASVSATRRMYTVHFLNDPIPVAQGEYR